MEIIQVTFTSYVVLEVKSFTGLQQYELRSGNCNNSCVCWRFIGNEQFRFVPIHTQILSSFSIHTHKHARVCAMFRILHSDVSPQINYFSPSKLVGTVVSYILSGAYIIRYV